MSEPQRPPSRPDQAALEARLERLAQRRADSAGGGTRSASGGAKGSGRSRRRHPAAGARAAALALSLGSTAALASFFGLSSAGAGQQVAQASIVRSSPSSTAAPSSFGPTAPQPTSGSAGNVTNTATPTTSTVVDGAVYHNRWGDVQVEVVFAPDGSLQSVDAIRTPNDRGTSIRINQVAVPMLDQEALSAQSADIHTISGATYTSTDYRRSLQSAIDAARAADITQLA